MAKYYDLVSGDKQWDFITQEVQLKYKDLSNGILNRQQLDEFYRLAENADAMEVTTLELDKTYQRFQSKTAFHSLLPRVFQNKQITILRMSGLKKSAEKLKEDIQFELKGKKSLDRNLF